VAGTGLSRPTAVRQSALQLTICGHLRRCYLRYDNRFSRLGRTARIIGCIGGIVSLSNVCVELRYVLCRRRFSAALLAAGLDHQDFRSGWHGSVSRVRLCQYCATLLRLTTVWTVLVAYEIRLYGNAFKALLIDGLIIDGSGVLGNGPLRENRKRHRHLYSQTRGKVTSSLWSAKRV
jgi:hypothetical protein